MEYYWTHNPLQTHACFCNNIYYIYHTWLGVLLHCETAGINIPRLWERMSSNSYCRCCTKGCPRFFFKFQIFVYSIFQLYGTRSSKFVCLPPIITGVLWGVDKEFWRSNAVKQKNKINKFLKLYVFLGHLLSCMTNTLTGKQSVMEKNLTIKGAH